MNSGGLENPMLPTQSTAKRKAPDDENPLNTVIKRPRKEASSKSSTSIKRMSHGEELPGGLKIIRGPPVRPMSAQGLAGTQQGPPRPPSAPPVAGSSKLPPKTSKPTSQSTAQRSQRKGKEREVLVMTRPDREVDEDVRLMNSEADDLRERSRSSAGGALHVNFKFPFGPNSQPAHLPGTPDNQSHDVDMLQPLPLRETPQIDRNKMMRGESKHTRRKSSLSMRGKRVSSSFENTGIITHPHTSVADSSFYKHIDADLPEAHRARQLLIWCSSRAKSGTSTQRKSNKDPPLLPAEGQRLVEDVEEDLIKMLAEGKIDTNVFSPADAAESSSKNFKENEQNKRNREREITFSAHIDRAKAEDAAWTEVIHFYNSHQAAVVQGLSKQRHTHTPSSKSKGKQRATSHEPEDWDPRENELPSQFRGTQGYDLARSVVSDAGRSEDPLGTRMDDFERTVDKLHALVNSTARIAHVASTDLDRRFAALSLALVTRSAPTTTSSFSPNPSSLSKYVAPSLSRLAEPTPDPQDLLRALARVDAARPQTQVGDAARLAAREVRRVQDSGGSGAGERRLTGVQPPTPRKPPGTPRKAGTPGAGRKT